MRIEWEGFRDPDESEDLPGIPEFLQPAVNGKLIRSSYLVLPQSARCEFNLLHIKIVA